jgi:signal transduction histidine kinase
MSAALAHQINNPLATLTNSVFLLRQQCSGDGRTESVVNMAQEALARVTSITRHLLSVYADQRAWKPTDFTEAVEEVVSFHEESASARNIRVSYRTRVPAGVTAPRHFRGLLSSLLSDAIETSRREGEVRIHVMELAAPRQERCVRLNLAQHSSVVPPQQEHLFPELAGVSTERMGGIHLWTALTALKQLNGTMRLRGDGSSRLRGLSVTCPLKSA